MPGEPHFVARVASVNMLGSLVAVPIGLGAIGPITDASSPRAVLLAAAITVLAATTVVLLVPDVRYLRIAADDPFPATPNPEPEIAGRQLEFRPDSPPPYVAGLSSNSG